MKFSTSDRIILRALFASRRAVDIYSFHEKYRLSPGQLAATLGKLKELGLAQAEGTSLSAAPGARVWIFRNRRWIFSTAHKTGWRETPSDFCQPNLSQNALYKPRLSKVDR